MIPLKSLLPRSGSHHCFLPFQRGLKFRFDYIIVFRFSGPFGRAENLNTVTGLGFSARAELRPRLNPSPCNQQFDFMKICAEAGLKFAM